MKKNLTLTLAEARLLAEALAMLESSCTENPKLRDVIRLDMRVELAVKALERGGGDE